MLRLAEVVELTDREREKVPSGRPRYQAMILMASAELVRAGWLKKIDRKKWVVTETGKRAYTEYADPAEFGSQARALRLTASYGGLSERARETAHGQITARIRGLDPFDFQSIVASLLRAMGYFVTREAPRGHKDKGVDMFAWSDPLGIRPPRVKVQVKRTCNKTDVGTVREFSSCLHGDDVGLFVTAGEFTKDAIDFARDDPRKITLIEVNRFIALWIDNLSRLDEQARRLLPLQPIYFLAPES